MPDKSSSGPPTEFAPESADDEDPVAAEPRLARESVEFAEAHLAEARAFLERLQDRERDELQEAAAEASVRRAEVLLQSARARLEAAVTLRPARQVHAVVEATSEGASYASLALAEACAADARAHLAYVVENRWGDEWDERAREMVRAADERVASALVALREVLSVSSRRFP